MLGPDMSGKYRDYYALVDIDDFSPLAHFSFLGGKTPYFPKISRSLKERTIPLHWGKDFFFSTCCWVSGWISFSKKKNSVELKF